MAKEDLSVWKDLRNDITEHLRNDLTEIIKFDLESIYRNVQFADYKGALERSLDLSRVLYKMYALVLEGKE